MTLCHLQSGRLVPWGRLSRRIKDVLALTAPSIALSAAEPAPGITPICRAISMPLTTASICWISPSRTVTMSIPLHVDRLSGGCDPLDGSPRRRRSRSSANGRPAFSSLGDHRRAARSRGRARRGTSAPNQAWVALAVRGSVVIPTMLASPPGCRELHHLVGVVQACAEEVLARELGDGLLGLCDRCHGATLARSAKAETIATVSSRS